VQVAAPAVASAKNPYLSDLTPIEMRVRPETAISHLNPVNGVTSKHGIFLHPTSDSSSHIAFMLDKKYVALSGAAAICDTAGNSLATPLTFRIVADGNELWRATMQKAGSTQPVRVSVGNVNKLELFVDCPGNSDYAHAQWVDLKLTRAGGKSTADGLAVPAVSRTPAAKTVDLFDLADLARQQLEPAWHKTADGLKCEKKRTRLQFPLTVSGDYTLHIEFTRASGTDCITIIFPVLDKQTALFISAFDGGVSGLSYLDGKELRENGTAIRPSILENGKRYSVDLTVRKVNDHFSIRAMLGDKAIVDWQGVAASLGIWQDWALPRSDTFGLAANEPTVFHQAKLKMLSGSATPLDEAGNKAP
jgi:hypothetical protein